MSLSEPYIRFRRSAPVFDRALRWGQIAAGAGLFLAGIAIAPLPGPLGVPVSMLGLAMVLRNSYWAKRQFIRAQRKRPKFVYPFRRLLRKNPELAPIFWQQALRAEKLVLRRSNRVLSRMRKFSRRLVRRLSR